MKEFTEAEIATVSHEPIVGGRIDEWLQQLMRNQNEIIQKLRDVSDKLDFHHPEEED